MTVSGLLFGGLIIAVVVVLVRSTDRSGQPGAVDIQAPPPQRVLADRFARGEIDEDEYTRGQKVLEGTASGRRPSG
jgi:putative membrane protein